MPPRCYKTDMNDEFKLLADALYWEKIERARKMTGEERMLEGVRMFDRECEIMRLEIMQANPTFTEAEAEADICRRIREARNQEEAELREIMPNFIPK